MVFPSYEELLYAIGEVVAGIESETLTVVFEHWMERLNGCLRTMVIVIHKSPVGSLIFLQCLSGTELLNLSGTHYRKSNATLRDLAQNVTWQSQPASSRD
jgi:hypothetical protein